jgi:DNA-binding FadR family transcriptional regulator
VSRPVHGSLLDDLGARIVDGSLPTGAVLTAASLEDEYSVSRTVVREAVQSLETLGMVASRRRVGITVQPRESWDAFAPRVIAWNLGSPHRKAQLEALMELRVAVEPMAARLAAERASDEQRAELARIADRLREIGEAGQGRSEEFLRLDVAFHDLLLTASGNLQLIALRHPVAEVLNGRSRLGMTPSIPAPGTLEEHQEVAAAITAGDATAAEAHSRAHMLGVWAEIQQDRTLE